MAIWSRRATATSVRSISSSRRMARSTHRLAQPAHRPHAAQRARSEPRPRPRPHLSHHLSRAPAREAREGRRRQHSRAVGKFEAARVSHPLPHAARAARPSGERSPARRESVGGETRQGGSELRAPPLRSALGDLGAESARRRICSSNASPRRSTEARAAAASVLRFNPRENPERDRAAHASRARRARPRAARGHRRRIMARQRRRRAHRARRRSSCRSIAGWDRSPTSSSSTR